MITEEQRLNLDSLSILFLNEFEKTFKGLSYTPEFTDQLEVSIPAKNLRVGDIRIWLYVNEVTVEIGELFHAHFETYLDDNLTKQEAEDQATVRALEFIKDVLEDKVVIEIRYEGKRPVRASVQYVNDNKAGSVVIPCQAKKGVLKRMLKHMFPSKIKVARLFWSGKEFK